MHAGVFVTNLLPYSDLQPMTPYAPYQAFIRHSGGDYSGVTAPFFDPISIGEPSVCGLYVAFYCLVRFRVKLHFFSEEKLTCSGTVRSGPNICEP